MEKQYRVTWTIDEFASSPLEAIVKALRHMPVPEHETTATIFEVCQIENSKLTNPEEIDLLELEEDKEEEFKRLLEEKY